MDTFIKLVALVDSVVELYLNAAIVPFLAGHEKIYAAVHEAVRSALKNHETQVVQLFSSHQISYGRAALVTPLLLFLVWGHTIVPFALVVLFQAGGILNEVAAGFSTNQPPKTEENPTQTLPESGPGKIASAGSDDESFEVVTTGSPQVLTSWQVLQWRRMYGPFCDSLCDSVLLVPCWIILLTRVSASGRLHSAQYTILLALVLAESAYAYTTFRSYFTSVGTTTPRVEGQPFSTNSVPLVSLRRTMHSFEVIGTALFISSLTRYVGLALLLLALPLVYEYVRRENLPRSVYVQATDNKLDFRTLKFWMQAKAIGSKLTVGFPGKSTESLLTACACSCVDEVVTEAPKKLDILFLEKQRIDFVVIRSNDDKFMTEETIATGRCLILGDDGVLRPLKEKEAKTD